MPLPHWNRADTEAVWDVCFLGGLELPGMAQVDVDIESDLDTKKPKGAKQASISDKGDKPSKVKIRLKLEEDADLPKLEAQLQNLRPRSKGAGRAPLEIIHPNPNFWGITAVTVDDVHAGHPDPVNGWDIEVECLEWAPEPIKVDSSSKKKPKGETDHGAWGPFLDDGVAGSGNPVANDSALNNLNLPDSRAN